MNNTLEAKKNSKELGNLGEELATKFLMKHDFSILERNYLKKCGELDIIARKDKVLHFIEVKAATGKISEYRPEENVHKAKLKRLSRTIRFYLAEKKVNTDQNWQIDVITVHISKEKQVGRVFYLPNIII